MFTVQCCSPNWTFIVHISGAMADCGDPLCCRLESGVAYGESQKAGRLSWNCLESWRLMIYLLFSFEKKTGAFSKVLSLKFLIQMGRLPKV